MVLLHQKIENGESRRENEEADIMKKYTVNYENRAEWNTENDINNEALWTVTEADLDRLAVEWGKDKAELLEQVTEA